MRGVASSAGASSCARLDPVTDTAAASKAACIRIIMLNSSSVAPVSSPKSENSDRPWKVILRIQPTLGKVWEVIPVTVTGSPSPSSIALVMPALRMKAVGAVSSCHGVTPPSSSVTSRCM